MKKIYIIGSLVALALIVFGVTGFAYAQSNEADTPNAGSGTDCDMSGAGGKQGNGVRGMMGSRGNEEGNSGFSMFDGNRDGSGGSGPLHDYLIDEFAQALGMNPEELNTRHQAGDTLRETSQEQGLTTEQFQVLMTTARTNAIHQAVADGVFTQERADAILLNMQRMLEQGIGPGSGTGDGSCSHKHGGRWNSQP